MKSLLPISVLFITLTACSPNDNKNAEKKESKDSIVNEKQNETLLNEDSLLLEIQKTRVTIESNLPEPIVISSENFRAKTKQKWQKIHFYLIDEQLARIKSYPYESISKRTEEFYFKNGELVLAVIEDDGSGTRGKADAEIDKMYFFHKGQLLEEKKGSGKEEYTIKDSDAEELLEEVEEYKAILEKNQ